MMNKFLLFLSILLLLLLQCATTTISQSPLPPPAPSPSSAANIIQILQTARQYTAFIGLLRATHQGDQINNQLKDTKQGATVLAPTDTAFTSLKSGILNSLSFQKRIQLVQFHIIPSFLSRDGFQTVTNPLRTQAGDNKAGDFPLNVTTSIGSDVSLLTGAVNASVGNTIYTDGLLAVYQLDKVLLPLGIFHPAPPEGPKAQENSTVVGSSGFGTAVVPSGAIGVTVGFVGVLGVIAAVIFL